MVNSPWLFPINMALYIPKQQFFAWEDLMTNLWTYRFYQSKIGIIGSWRVLLAAQDGSPLVNIQKTMENHHFQWENPLFLWSFSIVFFMFTRASSFFIVSKSDSFRHLEKPPHPYQSRGPSWQLWPHRCNWPRQKLSPKLPWRWEERQKNHAIIFHSPPFMAKD